MYSYHVLFQQRQRQVFYNVAEVDVGGGRYRGRRPAVLNNHLFFLAELLGIMVMKMIIMLPPAYNFQQTGKNILQKN